MKKGFYLVDYKGHKAILSIEERAGDIWYSVYSALEGTGLQYGKYMLEGNNTKYVKNLEYKIIRRLTDDDFNKFDVVRKIFTKKIEALNLKLSSELENITQNL